MLRTIVLDNTEVSQIISPNRSKSMECVAWFDSLIQGDNEFVIPEIVDYESRRGLLHKDMKRSLTRLDNLCDMITYVPLTSRIMKDAAMFWAEARKKGKSIGDNKSLGVDAIIAAQALAIASERGWEVIIATDNTKDFSAFPGIKARKRSDIVA